MNTLLLCVQDGFVVAFGDTPQIHVPNDTMIVVAAVVGIAGLGIGLQVLRGYAW